MAHRSLLTRSCAAVVMTLALVGCESMPTSKVKEVLTLQTTPKSLDLPPAPLNATEWADGDQEHLQNRAKGFGLVHMPKMEAFLNGLLQKIRQEAGVPNWPGKVYILANSGLDAYTQRSGNIYISLGYLQAAETEDELFALIAHEFSHSYLEYDALRSSLLKTDKAADIGAVLSFVGHGGDLKNATGSGGKAIETAVGVMLAYQLGRNVLAPAWSRSQEYAADDMAVQLSIRMGYSVEDGLVRILERQAAAEKEQDEMTQKQRDVLRKQFEQVRSQLGAQITSQEKVTGGQLAYGVVHGFMGELSFLGEDIVGSLTSAHPDVKKRMDRVKDLNDRLMGDREWPESRSAAWMKLRKERSAQRIFDSYQNATKAQFALTTAAPDDARRFARMSRISETQGHAMPALVTWQTSDGRNSLKALEENMNSPKHRAWRSYVIYAEKMMERGNTREANRVLDQGFKHFSVAPTAWVEYITMQAKLKNTKKAQELAKACADRFDGYGPACTRAANAGTAGPKGPVSFEWLEKLIVR